VITVSKSLEQTGQLAGHFLESLNRGAAASVVGLYGDLGSGKTAFVQAVARALGVKEKVTSPTFVIMKVYNLTGKRYDKLIHIDGYRLKSGMELLKLGFGQRLKDSRSLIFVEWPENVAGALPDEIRKISFKFVDETSREIEF
jgi:tRNA threonylcarbamoyladenosine biosynthesis protein TsaE